ncbi:MAG: O-antigen ligase family protein [Chloroflexi bacterium]|nr:O-antigen ligase family protein [Chloroflexota bacterium]
MSLKRPPAWGTPRTCVAIGASLALGAAGGVLTAAVSPFAGFAVILAMLLVAAVLINTQVGIVTVITIAYVLPFAVTPVPVGGVKLTFLDASLSLVLLVWILRLMANREARLMATPLDRFVLLFLGLALFSFVLGMTGVTGEAARFFMKTINSILFFFTIINCVRDRRQLEGTVKALLLGGTVAALLGLVFYFMTSAATESVLRSLRVLGYPTTGILRYIAGTTTLRAIGTSIDPNILGGMLMVVIPLGVSLVMSGSSASGRLDRRLTGLAVGVMVLCLVLTFSRSAWGGAAAGVAFLAAFRHRKLWLLLAIFAIALLLLPQGQMVLGRIEAGLTMQDRASQMRLGEYKDALRLIAMYPWFGVGFGEAPSVDVYVAASSTYLMIAQEMGLAGLAAFLATMIALFWHALRGLKRAADESWIVVQDEGLKNIQFGALAGVVAALTAGLFDHYFFNLRFPHAMAVFWLLVGLTLVAGRLGGVSSPQTS